MSEIYKINHIENNLIKHIYIFTGGLRVEERKLWTKW